MIGLPPQITATAGASASALQLFAFLAEVTPPIAVVPAVVLRPPPLVAAGATYVVRYATPRPEERFHSDDVSDGLVRPDDVLDRASVRRVLAALAELHHAFWSEPLAELCSLEDRYHLLSPRTARRELQLGHPWVETINRCWEAFTELVPEDIATAILTLAHRPG